MKFATLALGLSLLAGCSSDPSGTSAAEASGKADTRAPEAMHYSGRVDFDPAGGSLSAEVDIYLSVDPDEAELAFLLNGELELTAVSGDAVVGFDSEPMQPGADWNRVTVTLTPEPDARWIDLRFVYAGSPAMPENGINQISETWVELSIDAAWHPVVAAIDVLVPISNCRTGGL